MTTQPRRRKRRRLLPNPAFLPRCEWALRTGLAVALMSVLTFSPATAGKVALPGFGAFVAVMVVEMTLGKTLANVVGCTKGAALSCLGCKLLQLFLNAAVPARAGRDRDEAVRALLDGLAREAVVDDVVEHDAAPRVHRVVELGARAEARDRDGHVELGARARASRGRRGAERERASQSTRSGGV